MTMHSAEMINGLYKTELINPASSWWSIETAGLATARWVDHSTIAAL